MSKLNLCTASFSGNGYAQKMLQFDLRNFAKVADIDGANAVTVLLISEIVTLSLGLDKM